jgi:hypothetical protein
MTGSIGISPGLDPRDVDEYRRWHWGRRHQRRAAAAGIMSKYAARYVTHTSLEANLDNFLTRW